MNFEHFNYNSDRKAFLNAIVKVF